MTKIIRMTEEAPGRKELECGCIYDVLKPVTLPKGGGVKQDRQYVKRCADHQSTNGLR